MSKNRIRIIFVSLVIIFSLLILGYAKNIINPFKHCRVPILVYHCIDDNIFGYESLFVSPESFDKQMEYLKNQGYTPITFKDMDNIGKIKKPIMITFDDGYEDNFTNAFPILQKYNFKATVFLIANRLGVKDYLNIQEIDQMKNLVDFESHTVSHSDLTESNSKSVDDEFVRSKNEIDALTGSRTIAMAYPYGKYNKNVEREAKKYFKYAVTLNHGFFYYCFQNHYEIPRLFVYRDTDMKNFQLFLNRRR